MVSFEESLDKLPEDIHILGLRHEKTPDTNEWVTISKHQDGKL